MIASSKLPIFIFFLFFFPPPPPLPKNKKKIYITIVITSFLNYYSAVRVFFLLVYDGLTIDKPLRSTYVCTYLHTYSIKLTGLLGDIYKYKYIYEPLTDLRSVVYTTASFCVLSKSIIYFYEQFIARFKCTLDENLV